MRTRREKNKRKQQVKFEIYTCKYTALNKLIPIAYSWILALFTEIVFFLIFYYINSSETFSFCHEMISGSSCLSQKFTVHAF